MGVLDRSVVTFNDMIYTAIVPAIAGVAILGGVKDVSLMAVLAFTTLALGVRLQRPRTKTDKHASKQGVLAVLQDGLSAPSRHHDAACICFEIVNHDRLIADLGATQADNLIDQIVTRFGSVLRDNDAMTQLDNARFAIALPQVRKPDLSAVLALIERMRAQHINTHSLTTAPHLNYGFCTAGNAPARTSQALLNAACDALELAKRSGPDAVRGYTPSVLSSPQIAPSGPVAQTETMISALDNDQIIPYFQPQISCHTGQIAGMEVLARWKDDSGIMQLPAHFITTIAQAGRLDHLSEAMLNHALKALTAWDKAGFKVPSISVNFATDELRNPNLMERIKWDLERFDMATDRLTAELLETVIDQSDDDVIARNVAALSDYGVRVDLDDFGIGHASVANIARFKVDRLKIDRSFLNNLGDDPAAARMIAAVTALADQLGVETVAEGVETQKQKAALSQLGCSALQGFKIARPEDFETTTAWLATHRASLRPIEISNRRVG